MVVTHVDVALDNVHAGPGAGLGERHGVFDIALDLRVDRLDFVLVEPLRLVNGLEEALDGITGDPLRDFLLGAVVLLVQHGVALVAVGAGLDEGWAFAAARAVHGGFGVGVDLEDVVAVDGGAGNSVGRTAQFDRPGVSEVGVGGHAVLVVLADEDGGQVHGGGDVDALMEGASGSGAIAEEGDGDFAVLANLGPQRRAGGDRDAGADNAVGAEVAELNVGDVHGAALAAAVAGGAAEEFGHHLVHAGALGDAMAVAAVGAGDEVALVQSGADAGGGGFLADVEVEGTAHFGGQEGLLSRFLEATDAPHDAVDPAQLVVVQFLQDAVGGVIAPSATVGGDRLLLCQGAPPFASGRDGAAAAGPNQSRLPAPEYIRVRRLRSCGGTHARRPATPIGGCRPAGVGFGGFLGLGRRTRLAVRRGQIRRAGRGSRYVRRAAKVASGQGIGNSGRRWMVDLLYTK